jgi:YgiT-type zinc finger domain-containing protein
MEEMAEDNLDILDVEHAMLNGQITRTDKDDPRGTKYVVEGTAANQQTPVGIVGRFTSTGRYLIITVYQSTNWRVVVMYGYKCEYCGGTVQPRAVKRAAFKHKNGFIILEDITIGVCDVCGNRYYSADILHAVHDIATGIKLPERTEGVPVAHL